MYESVTRFGGRLEIPVFSALEKGKTYMLLVRWSGGQVSQDEDLQFHVNPLTNDELGLSDADATALGYDVTQAFIKELFSFAGNFTDFWYERRESMPRAVGRISKRGAQRKQQRQQKDTADEMPTLEERIAEAEERQLDLERRIAEAFARRDRKEGHRAAKQLARLKAQIDDLYEKWLTKEDV